MPFLPPNQQRQNTEGIKPLPPKEITIPAKRLPNCVLKSFLAGTTNYRSIMETFFQWTVNTGNCLPLSNQKVADLCLKCTKIRLAAGLRPDPLGELMRSTRPLSRIGRLTSKGREGEGVCI